MTREVSFPATVALEGGVLRGRATLTFLQSSFGYQPYSAPPGRDPEQGRGLAPRRPRGDTLRETAPWTLARKPQIPGAPKSTEQWRHFGDGYLPGLLGLEFGEITRGRVTSRLTVRREHMAPNGYLHAATVIALADTSCGYGTFASLPDGARGFTTIELKANFLNTVRRGGAGLRGYPGPRRPDHPGLGRARHGRVERARVIALFRCTQLLLYPSDRPDRGAPRAGAGLRGRRPRPSPRPARPRARCGAPARHRPA